MKKIQTVYANIRSIDEEFEYSHKPGNLYPKTNLIKKLFTESAHASQWNVLVILNDRECQALQDIYGGPELGGVEFQGPLTN